MGERWRSVSRVRPSWSSGRTVWAFFFWLWGVPGFLIMVGMLATLPANVGVGTSAYVGAAALVWIGGMLLFGLSALFCPSPTSVEASQSEDANAVAYPLLHAGFPYRFEPDGSVVARTADGTVRYSDWDSFARAVGE